jgi:Big-like domain-containing protein
MAGSLGCGEDLTLPDPSAAGVELSILGGDSQNGTVGEGLDHPLVVKVVDSSGGPIVDLPVAFVAVSGDAGGRLQPDTAITDSHGQASAVWILGTIPGTRTAEAQVVVTGDSSPPVVTFQATAAAGAPDTVRALSPLIQPGRRNQTLDSPLVVVALDRFGNPVGGAPVNWEVTAGGGLLSDSLTPTGADGTASVSWTLGDRIGVQKATAQLAGASGSPVTFSAAVLF